MHRSSAQESSPFTALYHQLLKRMPASSTIACRWKSPSCQTQSYKLFSGHEKLPLFDRVSWSRSIVACLGQLHEDQLGRRVFRVVCAYSRGADSSIDCFREAWQRPEWICHHQVAPLEQGAEMWR
ncbi:hypothetical protein MRB53_039717 [Persea americana]|nr:hypothetical protein MRB53_039717 [Persea americana]